MRRSRTPCSSSSIDTLLITVLVVLLFVVLGYLVYTNSGLFTSDHEDATENYEEPADNVLYFFLMQGCGWCDKLKPELSAVQAKIAGHAALKRLVAVRIVQFPAEDAQSRELAREFSVEAFPTIVLSRADHSKFWVYHATQERTAEAIVQWVGGTLNVA